MPQGWKKPGFFIKNPAQWVFQVFFVFLGFFWGFLGFLGFLGFFRVFWGFFCPEKRVSEFFSVSRILLGASRL
jgi:hypothetical protein